MTCSMANSIAGRLAKRCAFATAMAVLAATAPCLGAAGGEASWPADADVVVTLEGAIAPAAAPDKLAAVRLRLQRFGGVWHPLVVADSRVQGAHYNFGDHHGCIVSEAKQGDATVLDISLRIEKDPWSDTGGYARYRVSMKTGAGGAVSGTWTGVALGHKGEGKAIGIVVPAEPWAGYTPPKPGEHPRFLIRHSQIPALRAKAATPAGQRELDRLRKFAKAGGSATDRAVALGLLYHIEGDANHAAAARDLLAGDVGNWYNVMYVHGAAVRVVQGALALDLIHDACEESFRATMRDVFARKLDYLYYPPVGGFNPNDGSNWSAMYRSALGLAALTLCADAAPMPAEPQPPGIPRLTGEAKPTRDVPVVELASGATIGEWLHAGPFAVKPGTDVLAGLGGAAGARPAVGTEVACRETGKTEDTKLAFQRVRAEAIIARKWADAYHERRIAGGVDYAALTKRRYRTTTALHTVLHVAKAGAYRVEFSKTKMEAIAVWLGGQPVTGDVEAGGVSHYQQGAGGIVLLEDGYHPLTVVASIGVVGGWELVESYVRLVALDKAELAGVEAEKKLAYEHEHAVWQAQRSARERFGPADPAAQRWLAVARQRIALWSHSALGDAGWNLEGEAYTQHAMRLVLPFAHAYRNAYGRSVFEDRNLSATFPLYATKTVFGPGGAAMPDYGPGGGPLGVDNWARGFALVEDRFRPACLDAWDRTQALADAGNLIGPMQPVAQLDGVSAALRFINHPGESVKPRAGAGLTPLTVDHLRGAVVCRNRWQDGNDAVVTWFADTATRGGGWKAPDAGDFRVFALGRQWAVRGISFGNGSSSRGQENMRWYGNVVVVPEAPMLRAPLATDLTVSPAGEMAWLAAARFDNCYLGAAEEKRPDEKKPRRVAADLGIRATRQFAVDYSGACGAPVLVPSPTAWPARRAPARGSSARCRSTGWRLTSAASPSRPTAAPACGPPSLLQPGRSSR